MFPRLWRARRGRPRWRPLEACWSREAGVSRERRPPGRPSLCSQVLGPARMLLCECGEREGAFAATARCSGTMAEAGQAVPKDPCGPRSPSPRAGRPRQRGLCCFSRPSRPWTARGIRKGAAGPWLLGQPWDPSFHMDRPSRCSPGPAVDAFRCGHSAGRVCGAVCAWCCPASRRCVHGARCHVAWAWDLVCLLLYTVCSEYQGVHGAPLYVVWAWCPVCTWYLCSVRCVVVPVVHGPGVMWCLNGTWCGHVIPSVLCSVSSMVPSSHVWGVCELKAGGQVACSGGCLKVPGVHPTLRFRP